MKNLLVKLKGHWTFLLLLIYLLIRVVLDFSYLNLFLLSVVVVRIIFLKRKEAVAFLIVALISLIPTIIYQQAKLIDRIPNLEGVESDIIVYVKPLDTKESENYFSVKAQVIEPYKGMELELVSFSPEEINLDQAEYWLLSGQFQKPSQTRNFHLFDYHDYLKKDGIHWQYEIESIKTKKATGISAFFDNLRYFLLKPCLSRADNSWVGLHNKILFNKSSTSYKRIRDDLVDLGVVHLFGLSGFHLYYIRRKLKYLLIRSGHITNESADEIILFLLTFYILVVGPSVGARRVVLGMHLGRVVKHFKLPFTRLDQLAVVGVLVLMISPQETLKLSYLLSFMLTYLVNFYNQKAVNKSDFVQKIEIAILCFIFISPFLMRENHVWSVGHIINGLIFSLAFEKIIMPAVLLTTFLIYQPFSFKERVLLWLDKLYSFFEVFLDLIGDFGILKVTTGKISLILFVLLLVIASYWLVQLEINKKKAYFVLVLLYPLCIAVEPYFNPFDRLTMIDVGQGDAVLFQEAHSSNSWLVDTGGRIIFEDGGVSVDQDYADKNIIPALKALGVRQLSGLVVTHPDIDHIGNLIPVLENYPVEALYITPYTAQSPIWNKMKNHLPQNLKIKLITNDEHLLIAGGKIRLFTVPQPAGDYQEASNDSSIISYYEIGSLTLLNMADLSKEGEQRLLKEHPNIQADILKIGHHGSQTSSSRLFLEQVNPKLVLISAGFNNRYGHPHPEVTKRLGELQIPYIGTHQNGAVQIQSGLGKVKLRTALNISK